MSQQIIQDASIVSASRRQVSISGPGEVIILDPESSSYYSLDRVGAKVWALIQEPRCVADLCADLVNEFEVSLDVMARDLKVLLGELEAAGLVVIVNADDM